MLSAMKQAISIKLATAVVHFLHVFDFANVYMAKLSWFCFRWADCITKSGRHVWDFGSVSQRFGLTKPGQCGLIFYIYIFCTCLCTGLHTLCSAKMFRMKLLEFQYNTSVKGLKCKRGQFVTGRFIVSSTSCSILTNFLWFWISFHFWVACNTFNALLTWNSCIHFELALRKEKKHTL